MGYDDELLAAAGVSAPGDGYEDYNDYTGPDPDNSFDIQSPTKLVVTGLDIDVTAYMAKDFGIDNFDGDFSHELEFIHNGGGQFAEAAAWTMGNILGHVHEIDNGFILMLNDNQVYITEIDGGSIYNSSKQALVRDQKYYLRVWRNESASTYGVIYCDIYTDAERTSLLVSLFVAIHTSKKDYRYLYAAQSVNYGVPNYENNFTVEKLRLIT